ncbi:hypothetical protein F5Y16DRAFT_345524 [Xylariaceae sp. FL0255]|nr:hypothetical protein F5Y16DRAFT_345524 [Xylariaceae sp. FL0255]
MAAAAVKKTIAIIGATGNQGFSVARTFASLKTWNVRAITRNPSSAKAAQLKTLGCELYQANLEDEASLVKAFSGAHAIFLNTDFWMVYRPAVAVGDKSPEECNRLAFETEIRHGKNAVRAAMQTPALERLIYSALGPMKRASGGKYSRSLHWETKAAIVDYIESEPEAAAKTSLIYLGAYTTNPFLLPRPMPGTGQGGVEAQYAVVMPLKNTTMFPIIDAEKSTGPFVRALVEDEPAGKKLLAYDSYLSVDEMIATWSKVTGKSAQFMGLDMATINKMAGIPFEVLEGPAFMGEFGYMDGIPKWIEPNDLKNKPTTPSFEEWLRTRDMSELLGSTFKI